MLDKYRKNCCQQQVSKVPFMNAAMEKLQSAAGKQGAVHECCNGNRIGDSTLMFVQ